VSAGAQVGVVLLQANKQRVLSQVFRIRLSNCEVAGRTHHFALVSVTPTLGDEGGKRIVLGMRRQLWKAAEILKAKAQRII